MPTMPSHLFAFVVFATICSGTQAQGKTRAYLLAGQSNIDNLGAAAPGCGPATPTAPNVTFLMAPPIAEPLLELGNLLGQNQPQDTILVGKISVWGSALLQVNDAGCRWWINSANWTDPGSIVMTLLPGLVQLPPVDELHIVWGQGETDALIGRSTIGNLTLEYEALAQVVFAQLAGLSGHPNCSIHLVTIGAVESPLQSADLVNMVRLAHFEMQRSPLFPATQTIGYAGHHYDLPHAVLPTGIDPHHLAPCSYVQLGKRIADGLLFPNAQPQVLGATLATPTGNTIRIPVNVPLAPYASIGSTLFEVTHQGGVVQNVSIAAVTSPGTNAIDVTLPSSISLQASDRVTVRYVAGSGFQGKWASTTLPVVAAAPGFAGRPLAPFFLTR